MLNIQPIAPSPDAALDIAVQHAPYLRRLRGQADGRSFEEALQAVRSLPTETAIDQAMAELRRAKRDVHLSLAADDLSSQRDVMGVTHALSEFASVAVDKAMRVAVSARGLKIDGLFAIALGKMGAFELNYSSDIDFCLFYDPDRFEGGEKSPGEMAQFIARDTVRILSELTAEGYVFRTDLRLRPDPSSTPLAVSTRMAELYYEGQGQNWERMVWIKARPAGGDIDAASAFLEVIQPFVWRRHLDYWAIGDIQAIKRMINSKAGGANFDTVSPDVKLGAGGIREVEFFAQTQQLILGGRQPHLRDRTTLGALAALAADGVVESDTASELSKAYRALRHVEHRVQMLNDAQTHKVPADDDLRGSVAALCGYDDLGAFDSDLLETRRRVQASYDALFAHEDRMVRDDSLGNLVFTGVDDDPGTVETLAGLGFSDPSAAIDTIRRWHRGNVPATRTARGRELLTALLPKMLQAMGRSGEADTAFRMFSRFFDGLSSGVQTLSMLMAEPDLLDDLVSTLALAPRLASILSKRPELLEALVSGQTPTKPDLPPETAFETALDEWRRYHREQSFIVGHRLLHGLINASDAAEYWSDLADDTITEMSAAALTETIRKQGPPPGEWGVFAMGKLGGRELTAGSDLDIIVIYDAPDLDAQVWFTRFTQRLITALSAPTAEGELYEVDMRLRPSGRAGPVAVSLRAFEKYQTEEAWTWEHMALTRLRFVAGDAALSGKALAIAHAAILSRAASQAETIQTDVTEMRQRLYREKPNKGLWDLKTAEGGLIDIEFVAQQEMLLAGKADLIFPATHAALQALEGGDERDVLIDTLGFLQALQQVYRVALGGDIAGMELPDGLRDRLCRAVKAETFEALEAELARRKAQVHAIAAKKLHL